MLFRLYDAYDDYDFNNKCYDICFICFDNLSIKGNMPIDLKDQPIYFANCLCNGKVHKECLALWFKKSMSCPICRVGVIKKTNCSIIFYNYFPYGIYIYIIVRKISVCIVRVISVFLFIYIILDIYFFIFKTNKRLGDISIPLNAINNDNNYIIPYNSVTIELDIYEYQHV